MSEGITAALARRAVRGRDGFDDPHARRLAGQCLLDWLGCAIAGAGERATRVASALALAEHAADVATIVGAMQGTSATNAARANGVASHAIDFDDANLSMPGHPGVVIFPALLALAEARSARGAAVVDAFLAGYDLGCRVGQLVAPGHYAQGFHATATIGTFAAAGACGRLIGLDERGMRRAIGLAATQAAGLIGMFGSDAKPLHAGNAAANGLAAVLLAERGMTAREDALECAQGFAATHGPDLDVAAALAPPPFGPHHVYGNLFKMHAACYGTHATIEAALALRRAHRIEPARIRAVAIAVGEECTRTCDIPRPATPSEAKFSLRFSAAAALIGLPTGEQSTYAERHAGDAALVALRDKVTPAFVPGRPLTRADMTVTLDDGRSFTASADTSVPDADLDRQQTRLETKFHALVGGSIDPERARRLVEAARAPDAIAGAAGVMRLLRFAIQGERR